jgi:hypothetical protein
MAHIGSVTALPKLPVPCADGFTGHAHVAFGHYRFDIAVVEVETEGEPRTVTDDLNGKVLT